MVEIGVRPHHSQFGIANAVGVGSVYHVYGIADGVRPRHAKVRPSDRATLWTFSCRSPFSSRQPLMTCMRSRFAPSGSFTARMRKAGDLPSRRTREVAAHRDPFGVANASQVWTHSVICRVIPPPKEPYRHPRPRRGIGLFALHSLEEPLACVFRGPHRGQSSRDLLPLPDAAASFLRKDRGDSGVDSDTERLPIKLSCSIEVRPVWLSVLPITPNLKGFTPSLFPSSNPSFNAERAYSCCSIHRFFRSGSLFTALV